ncbi:MAG TPA: amidohydrolase family protein [Candidatus Cloacimonadota bacterium]|nr:amidohydrolase family protein [Candidatus Cloacimonadota bacterium]
MNLTIRNGIVNLNQEWHKVDFRVENGRIVKISNQIPKTQESEDLDASGLYIIPGMIDMHVHVDDEIKNCYLADTYKTGSEIAICNGITSFYAFITHVGKDDPTITLNHALWKTESNLFCNVGFHVTVKPFSSLIDLYVSRNDAFKPKSVKLYTTYRQSGIYTSYKELEECFRYFDGKQVTILIHCEDDLVIQSSATHEVDPSNAFGHTFLRPPQAEIEAIERVIKIAKKYNVMVHIVHVSTPEGVNLVDKAKHDVKITCETAPHYLFLNDKILAQPEGYRWLCSPPIRSEKIRKEMLALAKMGKIDAFATDHCAFSKADKDTDLSDFRNVPNGIAGLGALTHMVYKLNDDSPEDSLLFMSRHLAKNPAKIMGLFPHKGIITEGADADLCIVNPKGDAQHIKSSISDTYEPYPKVKSNLQFQYVILNGSIVVKDGKLLDATHPKGTLLCRS